jgi:hypothetical protein
MQADPRALPSPRPYLLVHFLRLSVGAKIHLYQNCTKHIRQRYANRATLNLDICDEI